MQLITDRQRELLRAAGGKRQYRVDITDDAGAVLASTEPGFGLPIDLDPTTDELRFDGSQSVMRSWSPTLYDTSGDLVPTDAQDMLHPVAGRQVRAYWGLVDEKFNPSTRQVETTVDWFPVARLGILEVVIQRRAGIVTLQLECEDLSHRVRDAKWERPYAHGALRYDAFLDFILASRYPTAEIPRWAPDDGVVPRGVLGVDANGGDPLEDMAAGARRGPGLLLMDTEGRFFTREPPDPDTDTPVYTFSTKQFAQYRPNVGDITRRLGIKELSNIVVLEGDLPDSNGTDGQSIRVAAANTKANSPTRISGPLGYRVTRDRTTRAMSRSRMLATAKKQLAESQDAVEDLDFETFSAPIFDAFDLIYVEDPDTGTTDAHVVEEGSFAIAAGLMSIGTKSRRVRS